MIFSSSPHLRQLLMFDLLNIGHLDRDLSFTTYWMILEKKGISQTWQTPQVQILLDNSRRLQSDIIGRYLITKTTAKLKKCNFNILEGWLLHGWAFSPRKRQNFYESWECLYWSILLYEHKLKDIKNGLNLWIGILLLVITAYLCTSMNLYISTRNQVLDEDSEFGGVTGWCRALLAVDCFPHQVVVLMTMTKEWLLLFSILLLSLFCDS